MQGWKDFIGRELKKMVNLYRGNLYTSHKEGKHPGFFTVEKLRILMINIGGHWRKWHNFFSAPHGLHTVTKPTPLLPPPHDTSTPKRGTYVRCPWPKLGEGSAPPVSLSELPTRSLQRNTDTPCWRTAEDRPGCEGSGQVPLSEELNPPSPTSQVTPTKGSCLRSWIGWSQ